MYLLYNGSKDKKYIKEGNENNPAIYKLQSHAYVCSTTFFDAITHVFLANHLTHVPFSLYHLLLALLFFIPMSFFFELILDFFHYWSHRTFHLNKKLNRLIHKTHHKHIHPVAINAYYFHPLDVFVSVCMPVVLTVYILPYQLSYFEYLMLSVYKQYTELAGHSGHVLAPSSSFPQCIWLPRLLQIELYAEDHDLHHKLNTCNFAKRFSLWDKVFGTYRKSIAL
jgi:sterol desaturase/sphingolipid hydroxylase (fatty acid hydroxylase superfamily)